MAGPVVGSVAVDVVPSARNFKRELEAQLLPQLNKLGDDVGKNMADRIGARLATAIPSAVRKSSADIGQQGRNAGQRYGDEFSRTVRERVDAALRSFSPRIKVDADTDKALAQMEALRRKLAQTSAHLRIGRIDDSQALAQFRKIEDALKRLSTDSPNIRIRVDAAAASAELAKMRAELGLVDRKLDDVGNRTRSVHRIGFRPLLDTLLLLSPALVAVGAGLAGVLGAGALAAGSFVIGIKGIQSEIKAGTPLGQQYQAMVLGIGTSFNSLKHTGAVTLLGSFKQGFGDIQKLMPALNNDVRQFGALAGRVASNVLVGLIAGFHTLNPLFTQLGASIERTSQRFATFSSGGGLEAFANRVATDWPKITAAFGEFGKALGKLFDALQAAGGAGLTVIGALSRLINALPLPVVTALVSTLLAGRIAFLAFGAAARIAGRDIAATSFGKVAILLTAVIGGLAAASGGFDKLADRARNFGSSNIFDSNGNLKVTGDPTKQRKFGVGDAAASLGGNFGDILKGTGTGNLGKVAEGLGGIVTGIFGKSHRERALEEANKQAKQLIVDIGKAIAAGSASALPQAQAAITKVTSRLNLSGSVTGGTASLSTAASGIQALVDKSAALDGAGAGAQKVINGISYNAGELSQALTLTNGNLANAIGLLKGNEVAGESYRTALAKIQLNQILVNDAVDKAAAKYGLSAEQVSQYAAVVGISAKDLATGAVNAYDFAAAIGRVTTAFNNANSVQAEFLGAVSTFGQLTDATITAADRGALIGATLKLANGDLLAYQGAVAGATTANAALVQGFQAQSDKIVKLRDQIGKGKLDSAQLGLAQRQLQRDLKGTEFAAINLATGLIDTSKAGAGPLIQALQGVQDAALNAASATYQHELATKKGKVAADDAYKVYVNQTRGALISEAAQLGLTSKQAQRFADKYFGIANAPDIKKKIEAIGTDPVVTVLKKIQSLLEIIAGLAPKPKVDVDTGDSIPAMDRLQTRIDQLHDKTINVIVRESTTTAPGSPATGGRPAQIGAMGMLLRAFAGGGIENHIPQIATTRPGTVRVWAEPETQGEAYIPLANDYRRPRAKAIASATVAMLGGVAAFASGALTKSQQASLNTQRANIRFKIDNGDVDRLLRALSGSTTALASATRTLISDVHNATTKGLGSASLVSTINRENTQLLSESKRRTDIANRLKSANTKLADVQRKYNEEATSVANAVRGSFDITNAGQQSNGISSPETILRSLQFRVTNAKAFTAQLAALRKRGLSATAVRQLAEAGPDSAGTNTAALAGATSAQLKQFNSLFGSLSATGSKAGRAEANQLYGAGVNAAKGLVAGLRSQEAALTKAMKHLANVMVTQIRRALKIHSPSEVFHELGSFIGLGLANGISSHESTVRDAAASLVGSAVPNANAGTGNVPVVYVTAYLDGEAIDHRADVRIEHHNANESRALLAGRL